MRVKCIVLAAAFLAATCCGQLSAQPIVTDGLTVYYSFDSDTYDDGVWLDGSGNNLHGLTTSYADIDAYDDELDDIRLLLDDPEVDDDVKRGDGAVHFDTDGLESDDYIAVCDTVFDYADNCEAALDNDLIPRDGFTVAAWVKVEDVGSDHSIWQSRSTGGGFIHTQVQGNGNVRFRLRGDSNDDNVVQYNEPPGGQTVEFEEWFHWAGTYQKQEGEDFGEWAFYYNGEEVAGGEANGNAAGTEFDMLGDWEQGAFVGLVPDIARQFVGYMDEFYLFHRGLTADEVAKIYNGIPDVTTPHDYNGNGEYDVEDLDLMAQYIADGSDAGDVDGDGDTDFDDRKMWVDTLQGSYIGDSNFDGVFNSGDLVTVFTPGKYESGEAAGYAEGDWNGDQLFNSGDLVSAFGAGGYDQPPRAATAAVPEPASFGLLLLGSLMLGRVRRRR